MKPVRLVTGRAVVLARDDVDTDQIIPSAYLKRIERTGFADGLFAAWRADPGFVLNDPRSRGATILVAGANFGCGSSREHAVWALLEHGFQAVIAPSFADIFRANCLKNGLVSVTLDPTTAAALARAAATDHGLEITVDVERRAVSAPAAGIAAAFALDDYSRRRLLEGLDDIGLTLRHADAIAAYEARRPEHLPRVGPPPGHARAARGAR